ncbi:DUF4082 domain-containing protein [Rhodococcus sp. NPDC058481]|uniref:DUF4082 domain-containing protein n=1 Tax=unclassified Rhodococcus (in: high G+C Gram-positive bacteria) TaxID=192944 RepID=UPI00365CB18F
MRAAGRNRERRTIRARAISAIAAIAAVAVVCSSCVSPDHAADIPAPADGRIWSDEAVPAVPNDPDTRSVEVGTRFSTASGGEIVAARFYQGRDDMAIGAATLWTSKGTALATVSVPPGRGGWREVPFDEPVRVTATEDYVISYHAPNGRYPSDRATFAQGRTVTSGWITAHGGVLAPTGGFPDQSSDGLGYFVDVVFEPTGPTLRAVDGGDRYYDAFKNSLPTSADFFPLGVWFTNTRTAQEIAADRAVGLNTYVELTEDSNLQLIADGGMYAIPSSGRTPSTGQLTTDEADMWAGPGDAPWTGKTPPDDPICIPAEAECGYTVMWQLRRRVPPGVMVFSNYGKGVTFWEPRDAAARFVNDFQDVVSVDNYWFTDNNICDATEGGALKANGERSLSDGECHLAANYGVTTKYVRSLVQPRAAIPVWNFVEVGHPMATGKGSTITGPQIRAAVWSSIINGARGIVYFNHNFGGPCISHNVLRGSCGDAVRGDVTAVNQQIRRLAPVLNAPFVDGFARSDEPVDIAAKFHDGSFYLLVGSEQSAETDAAFAITCGDATSVEVVEENRTIPITNGTFRDTFADANAVHIYRITGGDSCAPAGT